MKRFQITYQVQGGVSFPLDMLRYDACWPMTAADVLKIEPSPEHSRRAVTLCHIGSRHWVPTTGRWSSFSWTVVDHVKEPM